MAELLFCLPMANGGLERVFSQLKLIKSSHRVCLGEDTLDQVLRIHVEGPALGEWKADGALHLWLKDKARRVKHKEKQRSTSGSLMMIVVKMIVKVKCFVWRSGRIDEDSDKHNSSDSDSDICILD